MEQHDLRNWKEFEEQITLLEGCRTRRKTETSLHVSPLLFRGQSDASWRLTTTLERVTAKPVTLRQYYRAISGAKSQIEVFTGTQWDVPSLPEYESWLSSERTLTPGKFPGYEYMVYLRHHGFPSPLLDWSSSPYVAAYFAFAHARTSNERVAIFAYWEYPGSGKLWSASQPHIHGLGPYVRGHKRHFLQRSEYTVCLVFDQVHRYGPHEEAFATGEEQQDLLWKFTLPATERVEVLRLLDRYNLNAFSLFGSEESLMETLALREVVFREAEL